MSTAQAQKFSGRLLLLASGAAFVAVSIALAQVHADEGAPKAQAQMKNPDGKDLGTIELTQTPNGVLLQGTLKSIPEGEHGFHIHATGRCDPATGFKSAGGHLAAGRKHGLKAPGGPHPGDMPNVHAGADGTLKVEAVTPTASLASEGDAPLLDGDGTAIVVHAEADDYESQPSGEAGERIACGVIERR